jgi:hypothetical protein
VTIIVTLPCDDVHHAINVVMCNANEWVNVSGTHQPINQSINCIMGHIYGTAVMRNGWQWQWLMRLL